MLSPRKIGKTWKVDGTVEGQRVRLSLGTRDREAAKKTVSDIELAMIDGKNSSRWLSLQTILPPKSFQVFANAVGWNPEPAKTAPIWSDLVCEFSTNFQRKVLQGDRSELTWRRYELACDTFTKFLKLRGISRLDEISRRVVEDFKAHRLDAILKQKHSRGGAGLHLDIAILHGVFAFGISVDLIAVKNPVKCEKTPGKRPELGAQPFKNEELQRLRRAAGPDLLAFLLLRHTGFRGFDAADLKWSEVDLRERSISRVTHKRRKSVWVSLHPELHFALETECEKQRPQLADRVLLNPDTGRPMTRPGLYRRIKVLGERAGVERAHPHRFRDTLAVDLLAKGATPYDVSKILGDTIAVIEEHYAPYVKELRERGRRLMESGGGIEPLSNSKQTTGGSESDGTFLARSSAPKGHVQ
ncbi:MAG TPA: site-specific integrase [Candidatus Acidoferrales bacterium]|jgi:integrase|nr:site-specific integrase [Candidatus Acidoferrales bacterium]